MTDKGNAIVKNGRYERNGKSGTLTLVSYDVCRKTRRLFFEPGDRHNKVHVMR